MDRRDLPPIRSFPRAFVPGIEDPFPASLELPEEELRKFRNVLRLGNGDKVVILPNDGRAVLCELDRRNAKPLLTEHPQTDSPITLTLALGLPKPDALEHAVRQATELGVARFVLFTAERTVAKWDTDKWDKKLRRLQTIAREAAEVCFRTRLPEFEVFNDLPELLQTHSDAHVLSETEGIPRTLPMLKGQATIVIGPEGGWAPCEVELIGDRAVTMGPRVFRVDTAVAAACSLALLR